MSTQASEVVETTSSEMANLSTGEIQTIDTGNVSPLALLLQDKEHSLDKIDRIWEINKEWEGREARKEFVFAKAQMRKELVPIAKNQTNDFLGNEYADIDAMLEGYGPIAGKHGLDVDFAYDQLSQPGQVIVICSATHEKGHVEQRSAMFPIMKPIQGKKGNATNESQMVAIAMTYGRRYSFSALFAVACGKDKDGGPPQQTQTMVIEDYPEKKFQDNWHHWVARVEAKKNTAAEIVEQITRGFALSESQVEQFFLLKKHEPKKESETEPTDSDTVNTKSSAKPEQKEEQQSEEQNPFHSDEDFKKLYPMWQKRVEKGEHTAEQLIEIILSTHSLTEEQLKNVKGLADCQPVDQQEVS